MGAFVSPPGVQLPTSGSFGTTAESIVSSASYRANGAGTAAYSAIEQLTALSTSLTVPSSSVDLGSVQVTPIDYSERASLGDLQLDTDMPTNDISVPELASISGFEAVNVPAFTFTAPSFNEPSVPARQSFSTPQKPSINTSVSVPTAPSLELPSTPTLDDISLPDAPNITLPAFDVTLPDILMDDPVAMSWTPTPYNSDIWSDLLNKVLADIRNGGTGLDVEVEQEIYDRALARQQAENDRAYQEVERKFGASGFDLPNGALTSSLLQVSNQINRSNTEINGQVMIDQAKLAQDNTHFIIDKGIQLEGIMRDFFHKEEARLLDASKSIASASVDTANLMVNKYNAQVQKYKTDADVFEAKTRAALLALEEFKGKIEGAKVKAETQQLLVSIYNSQLGSLETQINLYSEEVKAANLTLGLEKTKIEIYQAEVQAFISNLESDKINFDIYGAQLKGEEVKAGIYDTQVQSHRSLVDIEKLKADLQLTEAEVIAKSNDTVIAKYKADLLSYTAELDFKAKSIAAQIDGFKSEAIAYGAQTDAVKSINDAKIAEMRNLILKYESDIKKATVELEVSSRNFASLNDLKTKAATGIANVSAQLAASAYGSLHATASVSSTFGQTIGSNASVTGTISEQHSFDETKSA